jgi:hypothetical protein
MRDSGGKTLRSSGAAVGVFRVALFATVFVVRFPLSFFGAAFFIGFFEEAFGVGILFEAFLAICPAWEAANSAVNRCAVITPEP